MLVVLMGCKGGCYKAKNGVDRVDLSDCLFGGLIVIVKRSQSQQQPCINTRNHEKYRT